jgi:hypothetical protein
MIIITILLVIIAIGVLLLSEPGKKLLLAIAGAIGIAIPVILILLAIGAVIFGIYLLIRSGYYKPLGIFVVLIISGIISGQRNKKSRS